MVTRLMPYGSTKYAALVSKVGSVSKQPAASLLPYGDAEFAPLVSKVGSVSKTPASETRAGKVVRLNARTR